MKKYILLGILIAAIGGGIWGYLEYNRKPPTAADSEAAYKLSADDLVNAFADEKTADSLYSNKVIEVSGTVGEITPNNGVYDVSLENSDPMSGVNFHLLPEESEKAKALKPGTMVTLKGIMNGINDNSGSDLLQGKIIELNKGVIVKTN